MTVSMKVDANRKSPDSDYDVSLQIFKAGDNKPFAELEKNLGEVNCRKRVNILSALFR